MKARLAAYGAVAAMLGVWLGVCGWDPFAMKQEPPAARIAPKRDPVATEFAQRVRAEVAHRADELRICFTDPVELGVDAEIRSEFAGRFPIRFKLDAVQGVHDVVVADRPGTATDGCVEKRLRRMARPVYGRELEVSLDVEVILDWRASITEAAPTVDGPLDPAVVKGVVEAHRDELTRCYVDTSLPDPALTGIVDLTFSVDRRGEVGDVFVWGGTTTGNQTLLSCLVDVISKWQFPAVREGKKTSVRYSFNFTPTAW